MWVFPLSNVLFIGRKRVLSDIAARGACGFGQRDIVWGSVTKSIATSTVIKLSSNALGVSKFPLNWYNAVG